MIMWNVLLLIALAVGLGVSFSIGSSWTERVLLASVLCGLIVYGFSVLTTRVRALRAGPESP